MMGEYVAKGFNYAGGYVNSKVEEGKGEITPETKEKWESIKKGTNHFINVSNDFVNNYVTPVVTPVYEKGKEIVLPVYEKGKAYGNDLTQKIENSENPNVIYARGMLFLIQKSLRLRPKRLAKLLMAFTKGQLMQLVSLGRRGRRLSKKNMEILVQLRKLRVRRNKRRCDRIVIRISPRKKSMKRNN